MLQSLLREEVINCMRCGLCLATCPTYSLLKLERASPRGRLALLRAVSERRLTPSENLVREIYLCLLCEACETACPAGVKVGHLVERVRAETKGWVPPSIWERALRRLVFQGLFPHPRRLEFLARILRSYQRLGLESLVRQLGISQRLPKSLTIMEALLPTLPNRFFSSVAGEFPPAGRERGCVAFFPGCIMNLIYGEVNGATIRVLAQNGYRTVVRPGQLCCGAPHVAVGEVETALRLARQNIDLFSQVRAEVIITNCAGCGAMLKEYGELLEDDKTYAAKANAFSHKVKDINEFLTALLPLSGHVEELNRKVTYHDPCHLAHAQGITQEPRNILRSIPGLELVELNESTWCCGGAGIYNITHSDLSMQLLDRKMANIAATGVETVVTSNPGCLLQLELGVKRAGLNIEAVHILELLDRAYQGS
ncbi:glycolate oxidase iron-sulfur subunit [Candidatus Hakubella thermalkaliphila]|uniref:Glycolate oxidase iron-sulfur subunit n=1 Tax=Candidatus Hakubella thermalkaliphila TaxID=2754717 RepID=A0A6V8NNX8_9ACTN|nr:(Fe-S)-binding protein [Candidatus Hakubella thermalkaliphila]GFP21020.1 glycolate oxidase iron-sulfur subunit [Candidatus Hakubella thermalkaliphila]GFP41731.1 glycolate oxidase iron-sulfur subunit [Candidatus Hakubella thermalkaliphila]